MKEQKYNAYLKEIGKFIPKDRIYTDELRLLAWGTDAGFYRLIPKIVFRAKDENEVSRLLALADKYTLPVTFRAAGTSLSGQSISDSILIVAGKNWEKYSISEDFERITLQPGIIGARVNEILKPHGRKFAPDPASVKSAMVGGIVMNNASGMNCGTHANSDKELLSAKIVLADGTRLNTSDPESRMTFEKNHTPFLNKIIEIRDEIRNDNELNDRIRKKYSIKNVTGLNLLPFVIYDDPFDIIAHLMVGSEGTLAFLSEVTMKTEHDYPYSASAMLYFSNIKDACRAVVAMKPGPVFSAELLDKKSLASVNDTTGTDLTAVLTETKADTPEELQANIEEIKKILSPFETVTPIHFTDKPEEYSKYWAIRSGIFPSVGGTRRPGTTVLIEDVAFPLKELPEATADLQELLVTNEYHDACIYGHALEGNFHFIISQSFDSPEQVARYEKLMDEVKTLVVDKYDGSLKAEHGTGRNMAPFVKYEWGERAYGFMKAVKELFDPKGLLNPGVIFNEDPHCHLKHFKPMPLTNAHVDKCIECGFCEVNCLTCGFSLSSRQRIVIQREISRLKKLSDTESSERLKTLQKQYKYLGNATCAGDGLCSMSCPMGINVGDLTHDIRQANLPEKSIGYKTGDFVANHFAETKSALRPVLYLANMAHNMLGDKVMSSIGQGLHQIGVPLWTPSMPKPYYPHRIQQHEESLKVVYFPSCINQTMGTAKDSPDQTPLIDKTVALLQKAGYEVIFPENMKNLCCGTIWESKGMMDIADRKSAELEAALYKASNGGKYPVLCDQSPCLHRMREVMTQVKLYEPVEFIYTFLKDKLVFSPIDEPIAVHITCSMRKMNLGNMLVDLARLCSTKVIVPEEVGCCGFAGDRGFTYPEVNAYALRKLKPQIEKAGVKTGYSNSRTCEIGLTTNAGIPYISIVYLVDKCTTSKNNAMNNPPNKRLLSLDILRGITIAGMIMVNNPGSWGYIYAPLGHAEWIGLTPTDLVFPFFMFIMGISTYMSLRKFDFRLSGAVAWKIIRRTIVIFAIGLAIAWFGLTMRTYHQLGGESLSFFERLGRSMWNFDHIRILGVMPRLAICYGVAAFIALIVKHKYIPHIVSVTLIAYFVILITGKGFEFSEDNIISVVDRAILGSNHMYHDNGLALDPEGLLSTIPSICHVLVGIFCGGLIMRTKDNAVRMQNLFIAGTILTFAGLLLEYGCPISKKIWSPTFVLTTCGLAASSLALLIWIIDIKGYKKWSRFFEAFGINPLFMYVLGAVLSILIGSIYVTYGGASMTLKGMIYNEWLVPLFKDETFASLIFALLFIGVNWIIGYVLYKKKIYIKI